MAEGVVEGKLAELGLELPKKLPEPVGNYVGAVAVGNLVFVSGHGPYRDGELQYIGKVPSQVSFEDAVQAAQLVMLNCLADLKTEIGSLDRVKRIVKLLGMVNSDPAHRTCSPPSSVTRAATPARRWAWARSPSRSRLRSR
jgi:enamine deaminase RidA (YjgF/YER057c/UK114 family)